MLSHKITKFMRKALLFALTITLTTTMQSCKQKPAPEPNPFFSEWTTPYGVPPFDKIKPEHYLPAIQVGISQHQAEIDSIVSDQQAPAFASVIEALDRSGRSLKRASTTFSLINSADSNDELQAINLEASPLLSAHYDNINLNDALFAKVKAVYDGREEAGLDAQQMRLTENTYKRFVRAGALLDAAKKDSLRKVNERLSTLSVQFGQNVLAENKNYALIIDESAEINRLPDNLRLLAEKEATRRGQDGKWAFTLSTSSMIPLLTYVDNSKYRKEIYEAYLARGSHGDQHDNKEIINEIVKLRLDKARIMGYPSYAQFVLDDKMAKTPENVYAMLDKLWEPALKLAAQELDDMKAMKKGLTQKDEFDPWDWWFYAEKVRQQRYAIEESRTSEYFPLQNVTFGIFQLCNKLWGITFRPVSVPLYNPDCTAYEVLDLDNTHLGILYLDFHPRAGKSQGAWCGSYRRQSYEDGRRIAPIVTIVCNFTPPVGGTPALLTLDETETFFHEFGHAIHNLFSDVKYEGLGGVEGDFVELPSQIMENWAFEPELLKIYAKHYRTGATIPDDLIAKITRSSLFNQGFMTTELLAASYSDMDIHNIKEYSPIDVEKFEKEALYGKRGLISQIEPRYHYPYFNHIFNGGYSAGYYGYLWAEVLDKDAYEAFAETGDIFNKEVAATFRKEILERRGSEDGMTLYKNFRGTEPGIEPLMIKRGLMPKPEPEVPADGKAATGEISVSVDSTFAKTI